VVAPRVRDLGDGLAVAPVGAVIGRRTRTWRAVAIRSRRKTSTTASGERRLRVMPEQSYFDRSGEPSDAPGGSSTSTMSSR
jgi:hypothetical protein